ncbi:MAG: hypothetical protein M1832_005341 [Thelocarpon impressellum]|nr:MAG: hypothetical protein M1832_005341 [Thelocarpon impressellum]
MCSSDLFLSLIAILFPPIAVWVKRGICSADSLINIALCMLGFLPGLLHAWYIVAKYPDAPHYVGEGDAEAARVTYYYVDHRGNVGSGAGRGQHGYGATEPLLPSQNRTEQTRPQQGGAQAQAEGGEGASAGGGVPPSYQEAVKGDNKVQK